MRVRDGVPLTLKRLLGVFEITNQGKRNEGWVDLMYSIGAVGLRANDNMNQQRNRATLAGSWHKIRYIR